MITEVYSPRLTQPSKTNKYYIKDKTTTTTYGGYNKCIVIDTTTGSVLPNCTGYAWGRFMECQTNVYSCRLSRGNAGNWYGNIIDGYQRGSTPKLGSVMCWSNPQTGGHVAIVERIDNDGTILTSNSAYNGSRFYLKTFRPGHYNFSVRNKGTYVFQGFIYNPTIFLPPSPTPPTPTPTRETKKRKFPWILYYRQLRNRRIL